MNATGELKYMGAFGLVRTETAEETAIRETRNTRDRKVFLVSILDKESGETRIHREVCEDPGPPWNMDGEAGDWFGKDGWYDGPEFMWSEGNYSCDCNRYLMFQRAGGDDCIDDICCNDDVNRYAVTKVVEEATGEDILCGDTL